MKVRVVFKCPDAVEYALAYVPEEEREEVRKLLSKWIRYSEYVAIEVNTETKTAIVKEVRE